MREVVKIGRFKSALHITGVCLDGGPKRNVFLTTSIVDAQQFSSSRDPRLQIIPTLATGPEKSLHKCCPHWVIWIPEP